MRLKFSTKRLPQKSWPIDFNNNPPYCSFYHIDILVCPFSNGNIIYDSFVKLNCTRSINFHNIMLINTLILVVTCTH